MVGRLFLGRYQATRLLGEGGMGRVYLARQLDLGRTVVVKVMHDHLAADSRFRDRFERETLLMARFQHPYAVTLYDASLDDPQGPCIVMEFIKGVTLDTLVQGNGGHLSAGRVGRLLAQLCEVLQAAHSAGIVHRDLKPANLMVVDPDTPYEKIKVMDFGLAKLIGTPAPGQGPLSGADFAVGTPTYISPEQVRGEAVDHRSDLYSVGVILYELLTGSTPYGVTSTMDLLLAHATEEPRPLTAAGDAPTLPEAVESLVYACLAKDPAKRPASARELAARYATALTAEPSPAVIEEKESPPPAGEMPADPHGGVVDPHSIVYRLEAWMPESIAVHKLRGFMEDVGGEVTDCVPGHIRVRLGGPSSVYRFKSRRSWLGLARRTGLVELELRMERTSGERTNHLGIRVALRPLDGASPFDPHWRDYTGQIFCDLRGYLMGKNGASEFKGS